MAIYKSFNLGTDLDTNHIVLGNPQGKEVLIETDRYISKGKYVTYSDTTGIKKVTTNVTNSEVKGWLCRFNSFSNNIKGDGVVSYFTPNRKEPPELLAYGWHNTTGYIQEDKLVIVPPLNIISIEIGKQHFYFIATRDQMIYFNHNDLGDLIAITEPDYLDELEIGTNWSVIF